MPESLTALERVGAVLGGKEPDRVPLLLLVTMHGARELEMGLREYLCSAPSIAEGQRRMQARYGHDCFYALSYAAAEMEAWGGEALFREDGPPNAGAPIVRDPEQILGLEPPVVAGAPSLVRTLEVIASLKEARPDVPIFGVVVSAFSLPAMQLGLESYLQALYERPDLVERLLAVNEEFSVAWGNAQLRAGAACLVYLDPLCSPTMVEPPLSRPTGFDSARRVIGRLGGPVLTHFASGRAAGVIDDVWATGSAGIGINSTESLSDIQALSRNRLVVFGNLNGIEMRRWDAEKAESKVKQAIAAGGAGRYMLADSHGEIPWQVSEDVLEAVAGAVRRWGRYPLDWAR